MEFSDRMKHFLNNCVTSCDKCSYFQNELCIHPDNPVLKTAQIPYVVLGDISRYCGGSVRKENAFTVISHNGVNKVILSRILEG